MTEPRNSRRKQIEEKLDGCARCDDSFFQNLSDYDDSQECKGEELCRYTNCGKHLVIKSTVKHSHMSMQCGTLSDVITLEWASQMMLMFITVLTRRNIL